MKDEKLSGFDSEFRDIHREIDIFDSLNPSNAAEELEAFERSLLGDIPGTSSDTVDPAGREVEKAVEDTVQRVVSLDSDLGPEDLETSKEPDFRYELRNMEEEIQRLEEIREELSEMNLEPYETELYQDTVDDLMGTARVVNNLGDSETVKRASEDVYGALEDETVERAEEILSEPAEDGEDEKTVTTEEMKNSVERAFEMLEMENWNVEYTNHSNLSVSSSSRSIRLPEGRKFGGDEALRLIVHEVGGHGLRAANGSRQDYGIMATGAGNYHATEEGLNLLNEEETGLSEDSLERKYAARAKAVESARDGEDFGDTYRELREQGLNHDTSLETTLRVHRGGGFLKDHIYLQGKSLTEDYLEEGSIENLMVGKISTEHAKMLEDVDEIRPPEYTTANLLNRLDYVAPDHVSTEHVDPLENHG